MTAREDSTRRSGRRSERTANRRRLKARRGLSWPIALALAASPRIAVAVASQAPEVAEVAFLELKAPEETCYAGQELRLRLLFGFEQRFLAEQMIQPFRQSLDVPAHISASWLDEGEPDSPAEGASLAVNDGVRLARRLEDRELAGARFAVYELGHTLILREPGELLLEPPELGFAHATRFRDDLLQGRVAEDRRDAAVTAEPLVLQVAALPSYGRPAEFSGAVGRFSVEASAEPRELVVGESVKVLLRVRGDGDLAALEPPDLAELEGFHLLGRVERPDAEGRSFVYDLAAERADVRAIPPIALVFFEPGPKAGYRSAWTDAIPLAVRAAEAEPSQAAERGAWITALVAAVLVALLAALRLRRSPA